MTTAALDRIRQAEQVAQQSATDAFDQLAIDVALDRAVDQDAARDTLSRSGKASTDLAQRVAAIRVRMRTARTACGERDAFSALKIANIQLADLQAERAKLLQPIDEEITRQKTEAQRQGDKVNAARDARRRIFDTAPEWLRDELNATKSAIDGIEREIAAKPSPRRGEANRDRQGNLVSAPDEACWNFVEQLWEPVSNSSDGMKAFDHFKSRVQAHDRHVTEVLRPQLNQLRERYRRLEQLAMLPWPTRADLAALDASTSDVADVREEVAEEDEPGVDSD